MNNHLLGYDSEEERNGNGNSEKGKSCQCRQEVWFPFSATRLSKIAEGFGPQLASSASLQSFSVQIRSSISIKHGSFLL